MSLANKPSGGSKDEENTSKTEATNIVSGTQTDVREGRPDADHGDRFDRHPRRATSRKLWQADNPQPAGKDQKGPDAAALAPIRTKIIAKVKKQVANLLPSPEGNADAADLGRSDRLPGSPRRPAARAVVGQKCDALAGRLLERGGHDRPGGHQFGDAPLAGQVRAAALTMQYGAAAGRYARRRNGRDDRQTGASPRPTFHHRTVLAR